LYNSNSIALPVLICR